MHYNLVYAYLQGRFSCKSPLSRTLQLHASLMMMHAVIDACIFIQCLQGRFSCTRPLSPSLKHRSYPGMHAVGHACNLLFVAIRLVQDAFS